MSLSAYPTPPPAPEPWPEAVRCDMCDATCWRWQQRPDSPCYGPLHVSGMGDDQDPYTHFCSNPEHDA